jgi:hypothetical protein
MSIKGKIQTEDNPVVEEPKPSTVEKAVTPAPQKSIFKRALPWVIVALVFFIGGAVVFWVTLYQPKVAELQAAQTQVAAAADSAVQLQNQIDAVNSDLTTAKDELANAQATVEAQSTTIAQTDLLKVIYKFQADVNFALYKLAQNDPASARQALSYVSSDLSDLEAAGLDAAVLSGYKDKISDATTNLESEPLKSIDSLESVYSNLNLLIGNLK